MLDLAGNRLRERLAALFALPIDATLSDAEFDAHARDIFAYQYERNAPFAAYCRVRGRTPAQVTHWTEIPPVPTAAFKHVPLVCGSVADAEAVFRTSGTTQGEQRRGTHYVLDVALYHDALLPTFRAFLLPDRERISMLSLIPAAEAWPDSSLAHMVSTVCAELGADGSGVFASAARGIHEPELERALAAATEPVCLLGTSFSFVHWLDSLAARGRALCLPEGSRLMDTGGYKGTGRSVSAAELERAYGERLGLPAHACVNEYGMTELCSQQYDGELRDFVQGRARGTRIKRAPPWLRTRVVDAETLQPVPTGTPGLLQHFDLSNLGSVLAVQTEDIGEQTADGGVRLLGRVTAAPPRGCSIAMDDLLRASARERV